MRIKRSLLLGMIAAAIPAVPGYAQVSPEKSLETFKVPPALETTVWASEPGLVNPTNIDIDERGRVWALEGANYRKSVTRPEGDRILIMEDSKHSGKCDSYKVFVQDKRLQSPLGICKLGNKLIVAQSPSVFVYTIDQSGDHPVGEPQIFFTGFGGVNHDHGVHASVFGPDGRLYFNCGNAGGEGLIETADHKPVIDILGSEVGDKATIYRGKPKPKGFLGPRQGFAFSCNFDGSDFETYAYNFRNNYELCVDSFGTVWQSDNDDDGNQGVRINYVMEGGNFGYTGPKGSNWARDKDVFPGQTKQEAHWHQRWPGVVPNMLHTGQGAPCGILVYEGSLLPQEFFGDLIHADAGPNVVRAYKVTPSEHVAKGLMNNDDKSAENKPGAGYRAEPSEIIKASDRWFRPDDVCVAPDGSIYVSDWYDQGVGGHATNDIGAKKKDWHLLTGRVFRVAPTGNKASVPPLDLSSIAGQIAALESPNQATRYLGYTKLLTGGEPAQKALKEVYQTNTNPRLRARALWLMVRGANGKQAVIEALKDKDPDIRVTAVRAARQIKMDMVQLAQQMLSDSSPAVLRELCLAMRFETDDRAIPVLVKLADKYDGTDRWYLEAFGIGCTDREKEVLDAWDKGHQNKDAANNQGIEWRLKMDPVPLSASARVEMKFQQLVTEWRAVGPFAVAGASPLDHDFGPDKNPTHIDLAATYSGPGGKPIRWEQINTIAGDEQKPQWVDFVKFCADRHFPTSQVVGYFATVVNAPEDQPARLLVGSDDAVKVWLNGKPLITADITRPVSLGDDNVPIELHKGPNLLLCKLRQGDGDSGLTVAIASPKPVTFSADLKAPAPAPATGVSAPAAGGNAQAFVTRDGQTLPDIPHLAALSGDPKAGEEVFRNANGANCIRCHQIGDTGGIIGPPLTVIGGKLTKAQLYESILYPSAAIEMGYETWVVKTKKGDVFTGRKVEDTDDHVTILNADGKYQDIPVDDIDRKVQQKISIMPEGLTQAITRQDLVNVVEYLSQRK